MRIWKDIYVPMRDGVEMALDIYQPDSVERRPAVLIRTPYLKELSISPSMNSRWIRAGADGRPPRAIRGMLAAVDHIMERALSSYVDAGYAVVISDTRGTGYSEGNYDYYNMRGGPFDGFDTIEWIAEQPWCDGNVGMWGISGSAVTTYAAAVTAPPHLKAMVSIMSPADFYLDQWFPGGVYRYEDRFRWPMVMTECFGPLDPGDVNGHNYEHRRKIFEQRVMRSHQRMLNGLNPIDLDWATECVSHDTHDAFWKERSFAAQVNNITAAVLNVGVLHDHFIRGTMRFFEGLKSPQRLLLIPGALDLTGDAGDGGLAELQIQWFDQFLKGEDNNVLEEPKVRLFLTGERRWHDETDWPSTTATRLFLTSSSDDESTSLTNGGLSWDSPRGDDHFLMKYNPDNPNVSPGDAGDQRPFEVGSLSFTSSPLDHDLTVIGMPTLSLFAASDAKDVDFCVRVCDVFPDGSSHLLNVGSLKGSHVHSHESPSDLDPGVTYQFDVEILTVTNVFKVGHRIRVDVSASDFPFYAPNSLQSNTTIFLSDSNPSHLVLPVVEP